MSNITRVGTIEEVISGFNELGVEGVRALVIFPYNVRGPNIVKNIKSYARLLEVNLPQDPRVEMERYEGTNPHHDKKHMGKRQYKDALLQYHDPYPEHPNYMFRREFPDAPILRNDDYPRNWQEEDFQLSDQWNFTCKLDQFIEVIQRFRMHGQVLPHFITAYPVERLLYANAVQADIYVGRVRDYLYDLSIIDGHRRYHSAKTASVAAIQK
ncbi:hypothetical protein HYX06_00065 [Candidatus Woesearchaeota archaeon]|nr:hypothetical protein [Candidatus Woesearchaeota archaeon]